MARHCCSSGFWASLRGSSGSLSPAYGSSVDRADVALWWRSLKRKKGGCNGSWSKGSRACPVARRYRFSRVDSGPDPHDPALDDTARLVFSEGVRGPSELPRINALGSWVNSVGLRDETSAGKGHKRIARTS